MTTKLQNEWPGYLDERILKVINEEFGFKTMTPVQVSQNQIKLMI
jgi:hypothetical protein